MIRKRQFVGIPFPGVMHQKAQRVDQSATRGIIFDRPERWIVNTPRGQQEIAQLDWLVEFPSGNRYVMMTSDIQALEPQPKKKWWKIW